MSAIWSNSNNVNIKWFKINLKISSSNLELRVLIVNINKIEKNEISYNNVILCTKNRFFFFLRFSLSKNEILNYIDSSRL